MQAHQRLEIIDIPTCDVMAGTFSYRSSDGEHIVADFYVRCCPMAEGDDDAKGRREDAFNEQFTEQWMRLEKSGCSGIQFIQVTPNPFF